MKIKTITSYDVYNFGASLQAYALMKYLQNKGHDVEIIDYKPPHLSFNLWNIGPRWSKNIFLITAYYVYVVPSKLLQYKTRAKYHSFNCKYLNITKNRYTSNDDLRKNLPQANIYIAGSDQIWNTEMENGKDLAFYLDFAPDDSVKASYAASFAVNYIVDEYKEMVENAINNLDYISVREKSGIEILKSIGISDGKLVLDPVFLLNQSSWRDISKQENHEKYILIYDQENNSIIKETAKKIAKETGYKIYAIKNLYPLSYADKKLINIGPREFLGLVDGYEVLLTNSFHGTAFSIIFEKEFYVFKRQHQKVNSRMVNLLSVLNINDRIIDNKNAISNTTINYLLVNKKLNKLQALSYDYLDKVCS